MGISDSDSNAGGELSVVGICVRRLVLGFSVGFPVVGSCVGCMVVGAQVIIAGMRVGPGVVGLSVGFPVVGSCVGCNVVGLWVGFIVFGLLVGSKES